MYIYKPKPGTSFLFPLVFLGGFFLGEPIWNENQQVLIDHLSTTKGIFGEPNGCIIGWEGKHGQRVVVKILNNGYGLSFGTEMRTGWEETHERVFTGSDALRVPSCHIYTGRITIRQSAFRNCENSILCVVFPNGIVEKSDVCVFFRSQEKFVAISVRINNTSTNTANEDVEARFYDSEGPQDGLTMEAYAWEAELSGPSGQLELRLNISTSTRTSTSDYWETVQSESCVFRLASDESSENKKALLVRYGVGVDRGIFDVRNLLTDLGFTRKNIKMLYYDTESAGRYTRTHGQNAPTAIEFQNSLTALLQGSKAGDVRFLYIDVRGTPGSGVRQVDAANEGYIFAEGDEGKEKKVVPADWIADCVLRNAGIGVNLTVLTTAGIGDGILALAKDCVVFTACHETQANIRGVLVDGKYSGKDPWTHAFVEAIRARQRSNASMPTYLEIYYEAKAKLRLLKAKKALNTSYLGPSEDETKPTGRSSQGESNQDPQLIWCEKSMDLSRSRFLYPFSNLWVPYPAVVIGNARRLPSD